MLKQAAKLLLKISLGDRLKEGMESEDEWLRAREARIYAECLEWCKKTYGCNTRLEMKCRNGCANEMALRAAAMEPKKSDREPETFETWLHRESIRIERK